MATFQYIYPFIYIALKDAIEHGTDFVEVIDVGPDSVWGNPYVEGVHGTREEVTKLYRKLLWERCKKDPHFLEELSELHLSGLKAHFNTLELNVLKKASKWAFEKLEAERSATQAKAGKPF